MKNPSTDFKGAEDFILDRLKRELSPALTYHGMHHTLDVLHAAMNIADAENIADDDLKLLRIGAAFHDSGFIYIYKGHEEKGCEIAEETLPRFGFTNDQINTIKGMILATKVPQQPKTKLEEIVCDADLDYLGRDDVERIAQTLFEELKVYANITEQKKWDEIQINFLDSHHYHTAYSKKLREPKKQSYLERLRKALK